MRVGSRKVVLAFSVMLLVAAWILPADSAHVDVDLGEVFPDMEFEGLIGPGDYGNLGLSQVEGPFRLSDVPGEFLVLEFFNKSCVPCQRQVRQLESFYQSVASGELASRVRVLAVGAGNNPKYLGKYRARRKLSYPMTADPQFDQWRRLGEPGRTPFTVFLVRRNGQWTLGSFYFGVQEEGALKAHVEGLLAGTEAGVQQSPQQVPPKQYRVPAISAGLQQELARRLLSRVAGREVEVEPVDLPGEVRVFRAVLNPGGQELYAKVADRDPVCEVCHSVHFLFAFDSLGRVRGFEPIHVTKYDNVEWSDEDAEFLEGRLRGREIEGLAFDSEVDAVATATMSSALIFDDVRRSADLLRLLREKQGAWPQ